jgi:hypothetical protein
VTIATSNAAQPLVSAPIGSQVWFAAEKRPYTIRARGARYLICTKAFAARRTVIYTVVDLEEQVRGTENLIFGMGAETDEECAEMLARLEQPAPRFPEDYEERDGQWFTPMRAPTEVSHRNRVLLDVVKVQTSRASRHRGSRADPAPSDNSVAIAA